MKKKVYLCISAALITCLCEAENRVLFFVKTYPSLADEIKVQKVLQEATSPQRAIEQIARTNITSLPFNGLFATYAGYLTVSSPLTGQIMFPRKQQNPRFYLVITPRIEPVIMLGKTVHHFSLVPGADAKMYSIERKQDSETQLYFWETKEEPLPENSIVPLASVVIFAKPKNIYVPQGITPTPGGAQLILPNIYAKKGINVVTAALPVLQIKQFFRSIQKVYKPGTNQSLMSTIEY